MPTIRTILVLALITAGSGPAMAQFVDVATDNELFAAYCIGALQALRPAPQEKIGSFRAYLAARGAFTTSRNRMTSQGLNVAVERGNADGLVCERSQESCIGRCLKAAKGTKEEAESCPESCKATDCAKLDRCLTGKALPF